MTKMRSSNKTNPVAEGNRAAEAWAEAGAVVIAAASADGQAALGRAADAFTDKGKADKARAAGQLDAMARRIAVDLPEDLAAKWSRVTS